MNKISHRSRFASWGLAIVLFTLAIYSICATILTLQVLDRARESGHMSNLYQQAHYEVSTEDSLLHQYYINLNASTWTEYQAAAAQLVAVFHTVERDGDSGDRAFVSQALVLQEHFYRLTIQMSSAIAAHQKLVATEIHDGPIDEAFDQLETRVNLAAEADHIQSVSSVQQLDQTQRSIIISMSIVFAISLVLFAFFSRVVRSYQRKLQASTQVRLIQMEQMALTDPLTGLFNHRAVVNRIEEELLHCNITQRNCAILFVDVDHFKRINDTWGHIAGDAALSTVAQCLHEGIRKNDVLGRYGGEEFAILLPDIEQLEALELAERLRCSLAAEPCLWKQEETQSEISIPLTASFGLAVYPLDGVTSRELLEHADAAMYCAKHNGRNRVCTLEEDKFESLELEAREGQEEPRLLRRATAPLYAPVRRGGPGADVEKGVAIR